MQPSARRFVIEGRVQGVGFRWFVLRAAREIGIKGYVRNLAGERVEVYAIGPSGQLAEFAALLSRGPDRAEVRSIEEKEAPLERCSDFHIR